MKILYNGRLEAMVSKELIRIFFQSFFCILLQTPFEEVKSASEREWTLKNPANYCLAGFC